MYLQPTTSYGSLIPGSEYLRSLIRQGTIYLLVPKVRKGGYIPFFVSERRRSEQALIAVVQEAFINGVSTRKIERLAREMGIEKGWAIDIPLDPDLSDLSDFDRFLKDENKPKKKPEGETGKLNFPESSPEGKKPIS